MRVSLIGCAVLSAIALAACGGSHSAAATSSSSAPPPSPSSTTTQSTSTVTATATATATPTTTSGSGSGGAGLGTLQGSTPECKAAGLAVSYLGQQGATGNGEIGFALKNTGSATCVTGGYPGVAFLDKSGTALSVTPQRTTSDFFGNVPLRRVVLHSGDTASFRLAVSHAGPMCRLVYGVQVIAPDDTATMVTHIPQGAEQCGGATVSPMAPGTSAYHSGH